ncbi:hypothetical protein HPB47_016242 [Ixodes persulcatus]|uniref:Uncharacterized protein n=1 Tax=Ixodes persulcatus TaxID=34615 RepID=A0AC60QTD4_IXOPE|nr:hypothetical protein HPB47_016242 [Ixodes persulcatus]
MTEFLWRQQLPWLPKKRPTSKKQRDVTFLGGASLPNELRATLDRGPKFAFEPQLPPPEKLYLVRGLAEQALPQDRERCIAVGVDALCRTTGQRPKSLKMGAIVDHFKCANLKLLASDKEGGFVVLPHELYTKIAKEAADKNFKPVKPGSLNKVKSRAKELCCELDLPVLAKKVNTHCDQVIAERLGNEGDFKIVGYVDDYLVIVLAPKVLTVVVAVDLMEVFPA